jgi:hypothetical protein
MSLAGIDLDLCELNGQAAVCQRDQPHRPEAEEVAAGGTVKRFCSQKAVAEIQDSLHRQSAVVIQADRLAIHGEMQPQPVRGHDQGGNRGIALRCVE